MSVNQCNNDRRSMNTFPLDGERPYRVRYSIIVLEREKILESGGRFALNARYTRFYARKSPIAIFSISEYILSQNRNKSYHFSKIKLFFRENIYFVTEKLSDVN